jgi:hypothetical protein
MNSSRAGLNEKTPFTEAMLAGYKAFLCSGHFLYLREPERSKTIISPSPRDFRIF